MVADSVPDFSLIHPSRGRCQMAFETAKLWADNASNPKGIQYILSLDIDEADLVCYHNNLKTIQGLFGQTANIVSGNKNVVQAANAGAKYATGKILVLISDDFACEKGWDTFISENIDADKEEALAINDGLQPINTVILTLPILTKKLYDRMGYVYHPDFEGIYADNHLAEMCEKMGILKKNYTKRWLHKHWVNGFKKRDSTNDRHDNPEMWQRAKEIIAKHRANNFGIK